MSELVYRVCANVLVNALKIPSGASHLPPPAELRQRFIGELDQVVADGRRLGIHDRDLAEARYALAAFIDEQVMHSEWSGRPEWMSRPLQLELYQEGTAGENFFVRLRSMLQRGDRPAAVEAYYLCLALGFGGAYGQQGDGAALKKFRRAAGAQLEKALPSADRISPHAKPRGLLRTTRIAWAPLLGLLLGGLALIGVVLVALTWSVDAQVEEAILEMSEQAVGGAAPPPASAARLP